MKRSSQGRILMAGGVCLLLVLGMILTALPVLAATSISIGTGDVEVDAGATVTMDIAFAGVPADLAPTSIDIRLEYDKDVVNVDSITSGDYAALDTAIDNPNGRSEMLGENPQGTKSGDFTFAHVTLKAVGAPGSSCILHLNIREFVHNETAIPYDTPADRTFTIKALPQTCTVTANPDTYSTPMNTALTVAVPGVLTNDSDSQGHPLTVASPRPTTGQAHGTLTLNADGSFTYTPTTGYVGDDTFTYTAACAQVTSAPPTSISTVTIHVTEVPCTVTANPDTYSTPMNTTLTVIGAVGVLTNDTDSQGHPLFASLVTNVSHGAPITLGGDGSFTYTPNTGYVGADSFTYTASCGNQTSDPATVTINVTEAPPVHTVVANPDTYSTPMNTALTVAVPGVLTNDSDSLGHPLTVAEPRPTSGPAHGALTLNADGSFTYTPNSGYVGADTFTYTAACVEPTYELATANAASQPATVTINVTEAPPAHTVVANPDTYSTPMNTALTVAVPGVLTNDSDSLGHPLTVAAPRPITGPAHGTLTLNADGSFTYTPNADYVGTDTFTYAATCGQVNSDILAFETATPLTSEPATVTINVVCPEKPRMPVAVDDSYCTPEGETLDVCAPGILGNDTNPDQAPLSAFLVTDVSHGTLTLNADGSFTYEPDCGFTGEDSFTYRAMDSHEHQSNIATVTIIVEETPAPPIPEIATGVLCFIGLAGVGGFFLLRRHRNNQTAS